MHLHLQASVSFQRGDSLCDSGPLLSLCFSFPKRGLQNILSCKAIVSPQVVRDKTALLQFMNQLSSMNMATKWLNTSLGQVNLVIWSNYLPEILFLRGYILSKWQFWLWYFYSSYLHSGEHFDSLLIYFLRTKLPWRNVRIQENNYSAFFDMLIWALGLAKMGTVF